MAYVVVSRFLDREDAFWLYGEGDTFPRPGARVSEERIAYLLGDQNKLGKPVIAVAEDKKKRKRK